MSTNQVRRTRSASKRPTTKGKWSNNHILVAKHLLADINTAVSLSVWVLLKYREIDQLVEKRIEPINYLDSETFGLDYAAVSLLRKFKFPGGDGARRTRAIKLWHAGERQCRLTNERLQNIGGQDSALLHIASRLIAQVLGPISVKEWVSSCNFGPGSDYSHRRVRSDRHSKMFEDISVTREFSAGARCLIESTPGWHTALVGNMVFDGFTTVGVPIPLDVVPGNRITFVPKDSQKDRSIGVEPTMNIYCQKGLGAMIRTRLKRAGLDLDKQAEVNQALACEGSIYGHLATIDLSNASDTLSYSLVHQLLPPDWFRALDWCRSNYGDLDGSLHCYEKFSSMGNGFTFELESLIFWALCNAVKSMNGILGECFAYGDDIIVPTQIAQQCVDLLRTCGFETNSRKTYVTGPFRESCGADYFDGHNVRPLFIENECTCKEDVYLLLNGIKAWALRMGRGQKLAKVAWRAWIQLYGVLDPKQRRYMPASFENDVLAVRDHGIVVDHDWALPHLSWDRDLQAWKTIVSVGKQSQVRRPTTKGYYAQGRPVIPQGTTVATTCGMSKWLPMNSEENVSLREFFPLKQLTGYRTSMHVVHGWNDLGPWT